MRFSPVRLPLSVFLTAERFDHFLRLSGRPQTLLLKNQAGGNVLFLLLWSCWTMDSKERFLSCSQQEETYHGISRCRPKRK